MIWRFASRRAPRWYAGPIYIDRPSFIEMSRRFIIYTSHSERATTNIYYQLSDISMPILHRRRFVSFYLILALYIRGATIWYGFAIIYFTLLFVLRASIYRRLDITIWFDNLSALISMLVYARHLIATRDTRHKRRSADSGVIALHTAV